MHPIDAQTMEFTELKKKCSKFVVSEIKYCQWIFVKKINDWNAAAVTCWLWWCLDPALQIQYTPHWHNVMESRASIASGLPHQRHNANENIHSFSTRPCK